MVLHFLASRSFITIFRLAPTSVSILHLPNNTNIHSHISPTFEALQMLSVHVHIHSALRSLYRDSAVLNCDYCELNVLLFATVGNDQHGGQKFLKLITVIFCWWADVNKVVLHGT